MVWRADDDSGPGEAPHPGEGLPELLAAFQHGGAWDAAAPSARLAAALEAAAGPGGLHAGADAGALVGIVRQWAAIESWAAAGMHAALRVMMREAGDGRPVLRRRTDLPDGWDDSLNYEIAAALAMGPVSAGNLASLAWTLGTRLAGIGRLLADGTLTKAKAKLVVQTFDPLDDDEATRAEALIVSELAGKTYFQVERLAWRAALAVAPDVAERRRTKGERQARVTVFREESGAVGLSGRDLPTAQALSAHANVLARAEQYESSGAFPGQTASSLQALAYLHLLNGATAQDAIAFARVATTEPPDDTQPDSHDAADDGPVDHGRDGPGADGPGSGSSTCGGPDDRPDDDGPIDGPDREGPNDGPRHGGPTHGGPTTGGPPHDGPSHSGPTIGGPPHDGPSHSGPGGDAGEAEGRMVLPEVTVPLATLQRRAERAGENRLLGPLDPAVTRDLAAAAARSPGARWAVTVVDDQGYAVGHGVARPGRGKRFGPAPPRGAGAAAGLCSLPARVNITVTETLLHQLAARPRSGAPPGDWEFALLAGDGEDGTWALTLPGGRELAVRFDVVPTHECDHRYQVSAYEPSDPAPPSGAGPRSRVHIPAVLPVGPRV